MKRGFLLVISLMMIGLAGCGSEISVVVPIPIPIIVPPSITSSQFSQDTANFFVNGSIDFYAPDFDLDTMTVSVVDSRGGVAERTVRTLTGVAGRTSGTISFSIDYITYRPDTYTFTIYVTDRAGYISNAIYGTFRT